MRDIKFRGKRTNGGKWASGYYYHEQLYKTVDSYRDVYLIRDESDQDWEVNPETVGQFTGLLDNNQIAIYEHDTYRWREEITGKIYFNNGAFYCTTNKDVGFDPLLSAMVDKDFEIIGNEFENPS